MPDSTARMDSLSMCNMPTEELFTATVKLIETELNAIKGIAADTANKHPSRIEGPQYSWKTLCGEVSVDACKSTCISRCWRRTAAWLTRAAKAKTDDEANAEHWKIRFYEHDFPPFPSLHIFREIAAVRP